MYDDDETRELEQRDRARAAAAGRHARNLAALDALLALEAAASAAPWRAQRVPGMYDKGVDVAELHEVNDAAPRGFFMLTAGEWHGPDAALVAALRNAAGAQLAARRRVLERHAPNPCGATIDCARCIDGQENPEPFPCPDYLDAEAGLVMPHRCTVSVDLAAQLAAAACVCCGWSKATSYARRETGPPVAQRWAEVWARRHLEGDPAAQLDAPAGGTWAERLASARAEVLATPPLPSGMPNLAAFRRLAAEHDASDPTPHAHTLGRSCPHGFCRWPAPGWETGIATP